MSHTGKTLVDRAALAQVLTALTKGPAHLIRELQATRGFAEVGHPNANPIDVLTLDYRVNRRGGLQFASMQSAPKDQDLLLATKPGGYFVGRQRYGTLGEPQQDQFEWRCSNSGRFTTPVAWAPLPPVPAEFLQL